VSERSDTSSGSRSGSRSRSRSRSLSASPLDDAKALALRVLAFHARTHAQLRARLARAGFEAQADEVLAWAERLGYVDDAAYARARARALLASRVGPRRAEERLRAAGIDAARARAAVAEAAEEHAAGRRADEPAELALCREALARKLRGRELAEMDDRELARLARFLLGRGFPPSAVARLVPLRGDRDCC
jgi:regulatory protein